MGSKGQTTTTSQNQTYAPAGAGYVQNALNQAQNAAQLPFNIPQAPVAGFSQDQQNAFQNVNNAQGMAQPYFNQANQYFGQSAQRPDVASFYNPMAANVTAQMQNIFGQQNSQNTGQLTQAAGGVGADRIAVGQANLANQQGLAAGQTYAGLWQQAQQAAQQQQSNLQSAGYGTAALGSQAQNAALQGAQAQLGTGGLQQQLAQAQLNSPYQQQLAQAAFPYQQSQFLSGAVGALAPGLGGTTYGTGSTTSPGPSIWSQLLGGAAAGAGVLGQTGAFGSNGWMTGNKGSGTSGGYASSPLTGQDAWQNSQLFPGYGTAARGGAIHPFASGGGVSDEPVDVAPQAVIPQGQIPHIQTQAPQLNLTPPQQQGGGGGSAAGAIGSALQLAALFMARGGAIHPYAHGGDVGSRPRGYAEGGDADFADRWAGFGDITPAEQPYRMPGQGAMDAWRRGVDQDISAGQSAGHPVAPAMSFAGDAAPAPAVAAVNAAAHGAPSAPIGAQAVSPYSAPAAAPPQATPEGNFGSDFIKSPWAALTAAGLGIMGGTSPFAGVNIGQGAMQGLKELQTQRESAVKDETVKQAARRLELEAKHHEDQYTRMTPYQQFETNKPVPMGQRIDPLTGQSVTTFGIRQPDGSFKPVDPAAAAPNPSAAASDDTALPANARAAQGFLIPGKNVPDNVDPNVLATADPGVANLVRAIDEGRESITKVPMKQRYMVERLLHAYDPMFDGTVWNLRNKQQGELASNGNAGKMLLATNQLLPHLMTASDKAMEMANSNYPDVNTIRNFWLTHTGDPRVKEFQSVREVASMDAARLLRGTGQMAEKDIEEWRKNIAESGSPQALQGVIKQLADDLIKARVGSIQGLYRMNMRQEPPEFLWPESKAALEKIKANYASVNAKPGAAPPPSATPAAPSGPPPAAAGAPAVGEIRANAHGVKGRWNGSGWEVIQ